MSTGKSRIVCKRLSKSGTPPCCEWKPALRKDNSSGTLRNSTSFFCESISFAIAAAKCDLPIPGLPQRKSQPLGFFANFIAASSAVGKPGKLGRGLKLEKVLANNSPRNDEYCSRKGHKRTARRFANLPQEHSTEMARRSSIGLYNRPSPLQRAQTNPVPSQRPQVLRLLATSILQSGHSMTASVVEAGSFFLACLVVFVPIVFVVFNVALFFLAISLAL